MQQRFRRSFLFMGLWALFSIAWALSSPSPSPIAQLQTMANHMIAGLSNNKGRLQSDPHVVPQLVRKYLLPYADVTRMSQEAAGRYWRTSTTGQQSEFKSLFTNLVVSTYATALASYDGDIVKFYPLRGDWSSRDKVVVRSLIVRRNGQTIPVNYYLSYQGQHWLIYDFTIENVSMVQSYRSQFANTLSQGGMQGLIAKLRNR